MPRLYRALKYLIFFVLVVIIAAGITGFWLFDRAMPEYSGKVIMTGLGTEVSVVRDEHGVPHIFATNMKDAARALGYVHAGERFFQMEMQRRAGQGRLSELTGSSMLGVDKFIRTLGLYPLAQSSYAAMSPDAQNFFQAYADGVNAWLATHKKALPVELLLLHDTPEVWQPADSVVWGKLMALQLSHNYKLEMLRASLAQKVPALQMQELFPAPADNTPVTTLPHIVEKTEMEQHAPDALEQLGHLTSLEHAASNEWVIAGSRTESGKPILANDPHLGLEAPILWYLARIETPEVTLTGATVPGLPIFLLGQNGHIAWGFTTTGSDVQDLFVETVDPEHVDQYLTPDGAVPFATHNEIIHVKDEADVVLKVRSTRHGPVMSDIDDDMAKLAGDGKVMALAFTGLGEQDETSEALMHLNRAQNWSEFLDALRLYQAPPQNLVYADTDGNIGFINPGLVPIRKQGDGLMPVEGASGDHDWIGMVPFDELPQIYNPDAGFVFNANNAIVDADAKAGGGHYYGVDWEEPYRAMRLQQFFNIIDKHTLDTTAMMQADHISLAAHALLPYVQHVQSTDPRVKHAVAMLHDWDGTMDKGHAEPLLFEAWLYQMHKHMLVDKVGDDLKEKGPYSATTMASLMANDPSIWCKGEESCAMLITQAMEDAVAMLAQREKGSMENWRWGNEHIALLHDKVFSHVPVLRNLVDLSVPSSGDFYTLDRGGSFDFDADHPFARTHGGGFRGIYDLSQPDQSRFMITTGESGHVFSKHYGDFVPLWNDVKSFTISGSHDELVAQKLPELKLEPANP